MISAAVSELRESNQNKKEKEKKKNSEIVYFQFNIFPGHIIYPFFKPEVPFEHMYAFNLLEVLYTTN